ncbi:glycoside hydrolase family 5 protein [Hypholoma sublateritium FD-334 SS-4]|uniref:Glycoside hydrolase family 5 protein n=1 Tax=Hypholoma sublateritium (strain FD-334 SS-4) TaxID=945553 RepID=A0A0D2MWK9_HYPSF|nr:glycoside hydrolase family 5 protein [Hypholoma sublateritium FD-334 SS-4]
MGNFGRVLAYAARTLALLPLITAKLQYGFPYGKEPVRGVSLGGWLIIEDFTTHSLFDNTDTRIVDEWTFCQYQNKSVARSALEKHWSTYITEDDFQQIQEAGLNHVRIPIGYWAFDLYPGDEYVQGQLPYLLKAVDWAEKYCLKIIIDLYGAPGSQNGFINSGHQLYTPGWQANQTNVDRTTALVQRLVAMFKDKTHVVPIIGVLNEPHGSPDDNTLPVATQFYTDSYYNVRYPSGENASETDLIMMMHDAFMGVDYWDGFLQPPQHKGVVLDTHIYQMFSDADNALSFDQHIERACKNASIMATSPLWPIIGEWTATATDCGKGLNGRFTGARYDGSIPGSVRVGSCTGLTGNASTFSAEYRQFLGQYFEAQTQAYEKGGLGWVMWSWKMEDVDEWSYQKGLEWGWIPQDLNQGNWPSICEGKW